MTHCHVYSPKKVGTHKNHVLSEPINHRLATWETFLLVEIVYFTHLTLADKQLTFRYDVCFLTGAGYSSLRFIQSCFLCVQLLTAAQITASCTLRRLMNNLAVRKKVWRCKNDWEMCMEPGCKMVDTEWHRIVCTGTKTNQCTMVGLDSTIGHLTQTL